MARNTFFRIPILVSIFLASIMASANARTSHSAVGKSQKELTMGQNTADAKQAMNDQSSLPHKGKMETETEKAKKPVAEELAHIHHFHKERVKKVRRHHQKVWVATKILLILCHVALLVCAFLHVVH